MLVLFFGFYIFCVMIWSFLCSAGTINILVAHVAVQFGLVYFEFNKAHYDEVV